jgi:hypothetical protein
LSPVDIPAHAASIPTPRRTFPSTEGTIAVFADQLASDMSEAQYRFAATHFFSTKVHLRTEGSGKPLTFVLTAGQRHEQVAFEPLMQQGQVNG